MGAPLKEHDRVGINNGNGPRRRLLLEGRQASLANWTTWTSPRFRSPYFGWQVICADKTCNANEHFRAVHCLSRSSSRAEENRSPTLTTSPSGDLFSHSGWVRGAWPVSFHASDPSGVCLTQAVADGQVIFGPASAANQGSWQQCPDPTFNEAVNTADYAPGGSGSFPLTLRAMNAAGVWTSAPAWSKTIHVDNITPTLSLAGPTDAASTSGTQYLGVRASAGPSGVSGISCSLDSEPARWFSGASARVPVQGVGVHRLACVAANNAQDAAGHVATSAPAVRSLSIRQPAVSTVSFARIADTLRCAKKRERVTIPAQWIIERVKGHRVHVRIPAQTRTITVMRCHPRIVRRRVRVGHRWVFKRVVLLPRRVLEKTKHVRFGSVATVSGWLGTAQGNALGGQRVLILTAPDDGHLRFRLAATATTSSDGTWKARLAAGPSRIVRVAYAGAPTVEPAISTVAHLIVPASVALGVSPSRTHWGGTIAITGHLRGGHVPPAGELVVLRIGWSGGSAEVGHLYTSRDGHFKTTYTFLRGHGSETYHLWAATAHESDYPFAPGRSSSVPIAVGP